MLPGLRRALLLAAAPRAAPLRARAARRAAPAAAMSTTSLPASPPASPPTAPPPPAPARPPLSTDRPRAERPLLSVAPMMEWTDVHFRQLARLLSRRAWLYTEMVVDQTLLHNPDTDRFLAFPPEQRPLVLQLGGSDPEKLEKAAAIAARYGYDEINLNCGCPSDRVAGAGCFGASLMLTPARVAACCAALAAGAGGAAVTVKCRLGVDDADSYAELSAFVREVSAASPVRHFVIHARKCILKGLSPAQNRSVPPLRYGWVLALRRDFPALEFSLNGGVESLASAAAALRLPGTLGVAGVMVGRAAYHDPWALLAGADVAVFGEAENPQPSRRAVLKAYCAYADPAVGSHHVAADGHRSPSVRALTAPLLGLFKGAPRGKKWRAAIDTALKKGPATVSEVVEAANAVLLAETLDAPPPPPPALPTDETGLRALLAHGFAADADLPPPAP
jgi:tRNA-dihydrouridine synthase A